MAARIYDRLRRNYETDPNSRLDEIEERDEDIRRRIERVADEVERRRMQDRQRKFHSGGVVVGPSTIRAGEPTQYEIEKLKQELASKGVVPSWRTSPRSNQFETEIDLLLSLAAQALKKGDIIEAAAKMQAARDHAIGHHKWSLDQDVKGVTLKQTSLYDEDHPGTEE